MTAFTQLALPAALLEAVELAGLTDMTPVQEQALPPILENRDVLALAPTGSGKTAAFALGLLREIQTERIQTQALVLCPTRELADQVAAQIRRFGVRLPNLKVLLLTGGMPMGPQLSSLSVHDPHVVVGTPGRIVDLLKKRALYLQNLRTLVLDEADRMLDMGFTESLEAILAKVPKQRQTLMFSATMPEALETIARTHMQEAVRIQAAGEAAHADIRSEFFQVREAEKAMALIQVLRERRPQAAVVFCNTRKACDAVQQQLDAAGFSALALHGDYEQRDRDEVLIRFANESANVLVATDVAARGLDVSHVDLVINYDVPFEPEVHIHRVGRTGRAGKQGNAITLVGDTDGNRLSAIAALLGTPIEPKTLRSMRLSNAEKLFAPMRTLRIDGGKSDKLRPGDILGTLTGEGGLKAEAIGKIAIRATRSYVAIRRGQAQAALNYLRNGKIKGRKFRAASLD